MPYLVHESSANCHRAVCTNCFWDGIRAECEEDNGVLKCPNCGLTTHLKYPSTELDLIFKLEKRIQELEKKKGQE